MPSKSTDDLMKIALEHQSRLSTVEQQTKIDHERIGVLEKQASNMAQMPATVAALGQKVESMNTSFIREVDGLREQQKAHKEQMTTTLQDGFKSLSEEESRHRSELESKILNAIALKEARAMGWWQVLELAGKIVVGIAVIAEGFKLLH